MKKFAADMNLKPIYAVPAVLFLILAVVLIVIFVGGGGGGGGGDAGQAPTTTKKRKASPKLPKGRRVPEAPSGSSGVIDVARREGRFVVAQARGTVRNPGRISLRVSAAPKQHVTVDWQLSCFLNRRVKVGKGKYRARPPETRSIPVPMPGAETCIATAGAQLTRYGRGRVKISVVAG